MIAMCSPTDSRPRENWISLRDAKAGGTFRIEALAGASCDRLREIGFCETMEVQKLTNGRNLVCSVCGTRLAVSKDLAAQVMVKPASPSDAPESTDS